MRQRILFRADASKTIGYGHFIRSLALAGYLNNDFNCHFATFNSDTVDKTPTQNQVDQICKVCEAIIVCGNSIEDFNAQFLNEIQPTDIVVLDNYYYTTEYQKKIKDKGCKLVCIDDMHDRHMVCDLLLTVCPLERKDFSVEQYTEFLGGIEYGFLRKPFFSKPPVRNIQNNFQNILIAMGGADSFNLTDKMVAIVHKVMPQSQIDLIAGETVNISDSTKAIANVHSNQTADQIVALMDKADLGIFPASTICIEAMSRNLPIIAGYYVDNQKEFYDYGILHKYFSPLDNLLEPTASLTSKLENTLSTNRPTPTRIDFKFRKDEIINRFIELSKQ